MPLMRKLAALGVAAEAARRFAQKNPDKARAFTDKAAAFIDQRTKGKYSAQISSVKRHLADYVGFGPSDPVAGTTVITPADTRGFRVRSASSTPTPYKRS